MHAPGFDLCLSLAWFRQCISHWVRLQGRGKADKALSSSAVQANNHCSIGKDGHSTNSFSNSARKYSKGNKKRQKVRPHLHTRQHLQQLSCSYHTHTCNDKVLWDSDSYMLWESGMSPYSQTSITDTWVLYGQCTLVVHTVEHVCMWK